LAGKQASSLLALKTQKLISTPAQLAWLRYRRNKPAVFSLWFIALCALVAVLCPWLVPDGTPDANNQLPEAAYIAPAKPFKHANTTQTYWLGGDALGRDVLSRLLLGLRISMAIGLVAVALGLAIGLVLGALAGYFGGWVDSVVMFLINVLWAVPSLLLVVALSLVLGRGLWQLFVAIGFTMWVDVARMVRTQIGSLRTRGFALAARVLGFGHVRILFGHLLPNALGPVAILAAGNFATAILVESGLSFLGVGVQPPTPSLGGMVRDGYGAVLFGALHLMLAPGAVLVLLVLAFNQVGNALADALNTRQNPSGK